MRDTSDCFVEWLSRHSIFITQQQISLFDDYFMELITWNENINLTSITDRTQVYEKHFYDSLSISFFAPLTKNLKLIDIGSGAGFPSIPLKIIYPQLQITIVDSLKKRIYFLEHLIDKLQLKGITLIHGRAEDVARDQSHRERYDIATARAVAKLNVLTELCLPFVSVGGIFIAMKGPNVLEEINEAARGVEILGSSPPIMHSLSLPNDNSERHVLLYSKVKKSSSQFPRKAGTPAKTPLN
jgi:16S rRNA (guanine527-N7)-methyltransferase